MAVLKIIKFPDNILRKKARKVRRVAKEEKQLLADMAETMYLNNGVGLAAPQVGISKELIVIDVGEGLIKMADPALSDMSGECTMEEGCLSVPNTIANVKRAERLCVDFLTERGERTRLIAEGLCARAIQHEIDHLRGRLIVDRLSPLKRFLLKRKALKGQAKFYCQ
ncbi:peptide deformylase [Candidatus Omnitrophota bacterium]